MKRILIIFCSLVYLLIFLSGCDESSFNDSNNRNSAVSYEKTESYTREYYSFDEESGRLILTDADKSIIANSKYTKMTGYEFECLTQEEINAVRDFHYCLDLMGKLDLFEIRELKADSEAFEIEKISDVKDVGTVKYVYAICNIEPFGKVIIYALNNGDFAGNYVWACCEDYKMATCEDINGIELLSNTYKNDLQYLCAAPLSSDLFTTTYIFVDDGRTALLNYHIGLLDEQSDEGYNICYSKSLLEFCMKDYILKEDMPETLLQD